MSYEMVVGLDVRDDQKYEYYRAEMMPILLRYGGSLRYDFKVSEVLRSETSNNINRVFTLRFPKASKSDGLFSDPEYLNVKARYFENAVNSTTIISSHDM